MGVEGEEAAGVSGTSAADVAFIVNLEQTFDYDIIFNPIFPV